MKVEEYFKSYPASKVCYQTSDSLIFHQEGDARLHAQSLEDDEVKTHKKTSAKNGEEISESPDETQDTIPVSAKGKSKK